MVSIREREPANVGNMVHAILPRGAHYRQSGKEMRNCSEEKSLTHSTPMEWHDVARQSITFDSQRCRKKKQGSEVRYPSSTMHAEVFGGSTARFGRLLACSRIVDESASVVHVYRSLLGRIVALKMNDCGGQELR